MLTTEYINKNMIPKFQCIPKIFRRQHTKYYSKYKEGTKFKPSFQNSSNRNKPEYFIQILIPNLLI